MSPFSSGIEGHSSGGSIVTSITQSPQRPPAAQSPVGTASTPTFAMTSPLSDLELRIDPEKTIDLFTMKLKVTYFSIRALEVQVLIITARNVNSR